MPRQKISEFRAKNIIAKAIDQNYRGWSVNIDKPLHAQLTGPLSHHGPFVVKVDEAVKGRYKKGLVILNVNADDLGLAVQTLSSKGYKWILIEPQINHDEKQEQYFSLMSDRSGLSLKYAAQGGVNVEDNAQGIKEVSFKHPSTVDWQHIASETGISPPVLHALISVYLRNYFVFMEINPYVINSGSFNVLDIAVEVDDAGEFFVDSWRATDFRRHFDRPFTEQEKIVTELDANSPASFNLSVLEPNGSIFLLLSGGGASVVVADEIYNQGYGKQLANYGEYSGNPNTEETYIYTKALLGLLLNSQAPQKVLFIGGAVANFTDIAKTFSGIIKALDEFSEKLESERLKVYVRRGGPNQEIGLANIERVLAKADLLGAVHGPEVPLTIAVSEALREISNG